MASTYLSRTPSSAGSTQTGTFSAWVKKSSTATTNRIFAGFIDSNNFTSIYFRSVIDEITIQHQDGGSNIIDKKTTASFRDVNGWYHIVVTFDLSNGTAEDRVKLYVNGTRITSFSPNTNAGSSDTIDINSTSASVLVGYMDGTYFNGSMAHVHWIDGTAYDADTFGETDSTTGIWKPKTAPSVTYGTNGFFLKFENSGAFGTDSSGNGNNFTVNGTMTQTLDTPSNVFATGNPIEPPYATGSFSNGNLTYQTSNSTWDSLISTISPTQGKWYFEAKPTTLSANTDFIIGMADRENDPDWFNNQESYKYYGLRGVGYYGNGSYLFDNNTPVSGLTAVSVSDIVGCAIDLDNNFAYFSINGTFVNSGDPTSGASGTGGQDISTAMQSGAFKGFGVSSRNSSVIQCNFGNGYFGTTAVSSAQNPDDGIGIFEYDVPAGYRALCTKSINAQEYS